MAQAAGGREALSLEEILRLYGQPINEEQAWAVCFQGCAALRASRPPRRLRSAAQLRVCSDGGVVVGAAERAEEEGPPAAGKVGSSRCSEAEMIESLGIIIYKALDYGLKENEERELSPPLEQLIDRMANTTEADSSHDEGYGAADEGAEDEKEGQQRPGAVCTYRDVMKMCAAHLPAEAEAANHYQAVCRALFAETMELHTFLTKIKNAKENLKKIQEMDQGDESRTDLEELKNSDWARFWVQVMRDLRNGVKLKKVQERRYDPLPIEFQLTPYEMLMEDIRGRRYTLRRVMVNGDIPPRLKKSAHEIILDFIRSRPPLNPVSARKLKPTPPRPRSLHERILEEIKAERKLRPVSPEEIRRSRLAMRPLSMSHSFDLSDVATPESSWSLGETLQANGGSLSTAQPGKSGLSPAALAPMAQKRLLKAPTLAELDSSDSEEEALRKSSSSSSSASPSQLEDSVAEATCMRKRGVLLPGGVPGAHRGGSDAHPAGAGQSRAGEVPAVQGRLHRPEEGKALFLLPHPEVLLLCLVLHLSVLQEARVLAVLQEDAAALQAIFHPPHLLLGTICLAERRQCPGRRALCQPPSATAEHRQILHEVQVCRQGGRGAAVPQGAHRGLERHGGVRGLQEVHL
ncbi:protein spire homolog 1 isoform X7 [Cavia porcellus]|uniref:protein spire homolog 1 isoform X7 n=1 Tax=Cavia porcellus TaxID=10141 RepID=UPI002FE29187